jgi:hypothetical protein
MVNLRDYEDEFRAEAELSELTLRQALGSMSYAEFAQQMAADYERERATLLASSQHQTSDAADGSSDGVVPGEAEDAASSAIASDEFRA